MPRFMFAVLAVLWFCSFALAQSKTSFEVFGGYSYINGDFTGVTHEASPGITLQGWNASVDVKSGRWFGLVADFAGYYPSHDFGGTFTSSAKAHTFLFGPQVSLPVKRIKPFAHFLLGDTYVVGSQTFLSKSSDNSFTYAFGGGVDFAVTGRIALRAQFDSLHNNFTSYDNQVQSLIDHRVMRISTGVVFGF